MRKSIPILLLTLLALGANAQLFKIGKFDVGFVYVGPKVGMNFTKINRWSYDYVDTKKQIWVSVWCGWRIWIHKQVFNSNRITLSIEGHQNQ